MKKNLFVMATLAMMLAFTMAVVGCSNPADGNSGNGGGGGGGANPFVGTWTYVDEDGDANTITFKSDMSFVIAHEDYDTPEYSWTDTGTYTVSDKTAILTTTDGNKAGVVISGNSLYGCEGVFTKKSGNGTSANPLAGTTWEYYEEWGDDDYIETSTTTLTFNADMTCVYTWEGSDGYSGTSTGTYTVSGNTVIIQGTDEDGTWENNCFLNGNELFVAIHYEIPYTKK